LLYDELREKRGIGYHHDVEWWVYKDTGYFQIVIEGFEKEKYDECLKTLEEIEEKIKSLDKEYINGRKNFWKFTLEERFKHLYNIAIEQCVLALKGIKENVFEFYNKLFEKDWKVSLFGKKIKAEILPF